MSDVHPITHSVIANSFRDVATEMEHIVVQSARNIPVILSQDFSVALTDPRGRLVSATQGIPVHLGGIDVTVRMVLEAVGSIAPDEVILTNDPYSAANTHMPDFTMITPVAGGDATEPVLYITIRVDQADIGAKDPTRSPTDTKVAYNEGILIPPVKVVEDGEVQSGVVDLIVRNSRVPDTQRGDLSAMIGAVQTGKGRTSALVDRYGADVILRSADRIIDRTRDRIESYVAQLPDGRYRGESRTDSNPETDESVEIVVTVDIDDGDVTFDFTGTHEQLNAPINNTIGVTHAAVNSAWFAVLDVEMPFNHGCIDMLEIVAPEGTLVNPTFPHATGYSTVDCMQETMEACLDALADVDPENVPAGWSRWVRPFISGRRPDTGKEYRGTFTSIMGGSGAIWDQDGANSMGGIILLAGLVGMDPESFEVMYPMEIDEMELRIDSGGPGNWRGGLGQTTVISPVDHKSMFSVGGDFGRRSPPAGHMGGDAGEPTHVRVERDGETMELERSWVNLYLSDGDRYVQESGGGGGVGDPFERNPSAVLRDVRDEYVSMGQARERYGVAIERDEGGELTIQREESRRLRGGDGR